MKVCKRKLDMSCCKLCMDIQMKFNFVDSCSKCVNSYSKYYDLINREYEILDFTHTIYGTYATLLYDGNIVGVPISEIYDVREKD